MRAVNRAIDDLLAERRPDRYTVRDAVRADDALDADEVATTAWLDEVATEVQDLIPTEQTRRLFARQIVGQREGIATHRANDRLREIARSGQMPLGWMDQKDWPIAVVSRVTVRGETKVIEERVALRAATSADYRRFATEERRRGARDFSARNDACTGAEMIADELDRQGAQTVLDLQ
jgi:hypothetical protein